MRNNNSPRYKQAKRTRDKTSVRGLKTVNLNGFFSTEKQYAARTSCWKCVVVSQSRRNTDAKVGHYGFLLISNDVRLTAVLLPLLFFYLYGVHLGPLKSPPGRALLIYQMRPKLVCFSKVDGLIDCSCKWAFLCLVFFPLFCRLFKQRNQLAPCGILIVLCLYIANVIRKTPLTYFQNFFRHFFKHFVYRISKLFFHIFFTRLVSHRPLNELRIQPRIMTHAWLDTSTVSFIPCYRRVHVK